MGKISFFMVLAGGLLLVSCATIVSGTKQTVRITSSPSNAAVVIDGVNMGSTPLTTELTKKRVHNVELKLDGYTPYKAALTKKFNPWFIGNIAFGGIIGVIVDASNGAINNLSPKAIDAQLEPDASYAPIQVEAVPTDTIASDSVQVYAPEQVVGATPTDTVTVDGVYVK